REPLADRDEHVELARVGSLGDLAAEREQLARRAAQRGQDGDDPIARFMCRDEPARDALELLRVGHRRAAELHHHRLEMTGLGVALDRGDGLVFGRRHWRKCRGRSYRQTGSMRAMVVDEAHRPLRLADLPEPSAGPGELLVRVEACGVCRPDLHIVDGELTRPKRPLVIGHQIRGEVVGEDRRVGIPWLGWTDGDCRYCRADQENLCDNAQFTGYDRDGGYAEYAVADERFCFPLPADFSAIAGAPLLCAGLIGYRALRFT